MQNDASDRLLIGDIGSTKGAWTAVGHNGEQRHVLTDGYNPHSHAEGLLTSILRYVHRTVEQPAEIIYYGTGISDDVVANEVAHVISSEYPSSQISVESDLIGAARACLGNRPGVVAILGTGSNASSYDGHTVESITPSLGYPLGDEGSGWQIGSMILRGYYYGDMPEVLRSSFAELLPDTRRELLGYLRQSPQPNRYLASFATFAGEHRSHPWISDNVRNCLDAFIRTHVLPLSSGEPVYFVGSIAGSFEEILEELLTENGLSIGKVIADPLEALIKYHTNS